MQPSTESSPGPAEPGASAAACLAAAGLCLLVVGVYLPVVGFGFVELDDPLNFLRNDGYRGLGAQQLGWMFLSLHGFSAYDPIAWLSFGVDYTLFGLEPGRFHLTNLLLYALTALACMRLCVVALVRVRRLSDGRRSVRGPTRGEVGAALAATALLVVHPLRAETVAWLSERHGILAALFAILSATAYLRYTARRGRGDAYGGAYAASLGWFALAILSKSTVLFFPFCLLVLDAYPLRRFAADGRDLRERVVQAVGEKLAYFALSWPVGLVTVLARRSDGLWTGIETQPISERLLQSAWGAWFYLFKTFVPSHLGPIYLRLEYRALYGVWFYAAAVAFVGVVVIAIAKRRRWPWLPTTLALYLLLLLPTIGLFQSGPLVAADRYSFIALMPWSIAFAFPLARALAGGAAASARVRAGVVGLLVAALVTSAVLTRIQVAHWRDADSLWAHAIEESAVPGLMHFNRAALLRQIDDRAGAVRELRLAQALRPDDPDVVALWAACELERGDPRAAVDLFRRAVILDPGRYEAYLGLGSALAQLGHEQQAHNAFAVAFDLAPERFEAPAAMAEGLLGVGDLQGALDVLDGAVGRDPERAILRWLRARTHARLGDFDAARADLAVVLRQGARGDPAAAPLAPAANRLLAELDRRAAGGAELR